MQAGLDKAMDEFGAISTEEKGKQGLVKFRGLMADYRKAVKPVAEKVIGDGYPDAPSAFEDMKAADAAYDPALAMLINIEGDLKKRGDEVFAKVDGLVSGVSMKVGPMEFTRMPSGARSLEAERVRLITAPFEAL